jgi:glutathione S-transferase
MKGMTIIEDMLKQSKGKYCFGNNVTLADAFFYPQVMGGIARFGVNIEEFPLCKEVLGNLQQIEEFVQAEPKNQPDFEK